MSSFRINPNKFPTNYTTKIIVAQWPCVDRSIIKEENNHMFTFVNTDDFIYDNLIDYEGNTRTFDCNGSENWIKKFIDNVIDIANDPKTEAPYILIDGTIDIVNYLESIDMNFILIIPDTIKYVRKILECEYKDKTDWPKCVANLKAFAYYRHYMSKKAFRTLSTDEPFYNYLFKSNGYIDQATNRSINILLNHNSLIKDNDYYATIEYDEENNIDIDGKCGQFISSINDTDIINEVERMIKDPDYIIFDSTPDFDICDHEEEYPDFSDCEDCYD